MINKTVSIQKLAEGLALLDRAAALAPMSRHEHVLAQLAVQDLKQFLYAPQIVEAPAPTTNENPNGA